MKLYFIIASLLVVGFSNAQVLPQAIIVNNNAYPATISANTSFNIESVASGLAENTYPAIKSDFSWTFNNNSAYTIQFWVTKSSQNSSRGFIGFTTAADGLSYSAGSFLFYEYSGSVLRNYVKNDYANDNIPLANFALGTAYQITTVYDGTYWRNYVNGQLVNTNRNNTTWSGTGNLMIGNIGGNTDVVIDEVRFWNKTLSPEEVANNWNKPLTGSEDGLKVYYNFDNQGYPAENNTHVKSLKDQTLNNYQGIFTNLSLSETLQNFVSDISQVNTYDSAVITLDANILDSYPGNGHGTSYGNTNNKSAFIVHDLFTTTNLYFYSNSSYNPSLLAAPILNADGGRSFLINNIYGKTNTASFISSNDRRTFEAWVKFNTLNNNSVISIGNLADNDLFEMVVNNGKLLLNTGVDFSSNLNIKSNRTLLTNTWYHIVVMYEPWLELSEMPKYFMIYINGAFENDYFTAFSANQINFDAIFSPINTTNTTIKLGNSLRPFNGKLGSLKVYNRVLSATEILNKFNATKSRFGY